LIAGAAASVFTSVVASAGFSAVLSTPRLLKSIAGVAKVFSALVFSVGSKIGAGPWLVKSCMTCEAPLFSKVGAELALLPVIVSVGTPNVALVSKAGIALSAGGIGGMPN